MLLCQATTCLGIDVIASTACCVRSSVATWGSTGLARPHKCSRISPVAKRRGGIFKITRQQGCCRGSGRGRHRRCGSVCGRGHGGGRCGCRGGGCGGGCRCGRCGCRGGGRGCCSHWPRRHHTKVVQANVTAPPTTSDANKPYGSCALNGKALWKPRTALIAADSPNLGQTIHTLSLNRQAAHIWA